MAASWFWDRMAKRYSRSPVANEEAYQKKLEVTRSYLRPDMEVLEFACGTGSTAVAHAPYVKSITAIDISKNMLQIARSKAEAAHITNIDFKLSGIEEFEAGSQSFDVVMGHSILHLLEDRDMVIAKVHDLLKPDGVFVSSTTCVGGGFNIFKLVLPIGHFFGLLPLVRFFSVRELKQSIEACGFEIEHQWQPASGSAVFIVAKKPA